MKKIIYCTMCLSIFITSVSFAYEFDCKDCYERTINSCNRNYYKFDMPPHNVPQETWCDMYADLMVQFFAKIHNDKYQTNVKCEPIIYDDWLWPAGEETIYEAIDRMLKETELGAWF